MVKQNIIGIRSIIEDTGSVNGNKKGLVVGHKKYK